MRSDPPTSSWPATYSDGLSAKGWPVRARLDHRGIIIEHGGDTGELVWPYGALQTDAPLSRNAGEALIKYTHMPGARLFVRDASFVRALREHAGQLTTAAHRWRWARPIIAGAIGILVIIGAIWAMNLKPARTIAGMLPDSSRQSVGRNVIAYFSSQHKVCTSAPGRKALDRLIARLLASVSNHATYQVTVVDWNLVNAFAAPGGQMLLTQGLIRAAQSPEEVAGVLAHEIGHGVELHPETGLVRAVGLSAVVELLTGGSSGALTNLGTMFLQNSYVRADEAAADDQALLLLRSAGISQDGLASFFERLSKKNKSPTSASKRTFGSFDLLRTHPHPEDRAAAVRASPRYAATPALTAAEWKALRRICSAKSST